MQVKRINTYTTVPSEWTNEQYTIAKNIDIVTFASPSTIKIWTERVGNNAIAVVIGPTRYSSFYVGLLYLFYYNNYIFYKC